MTEPEYRYLTMLAFAGVVFQLTTNRIDAWRARLEIQHNTDVNAGQATGDLVYPWLAQHPTWVGIVVGLAVFAVGSLLISWYRAPEPTQPAHP
jgi:hypothetical protein